MTVLSECASMPSAGATLVILQGVSEAQSGQASVFILIGIWQYARTPDMKAKMEATINTR